MSDEKNPGSRYTLNSLLRKNKKTEPSTKERSSSYDLVKINPENAKKRDLTESQDDSNIEIEPVQKKKGSMTNNLLFDNSNKNRVQKTRAEKEKKKIVTIITKPNIKQGDNKSNQETFWNVDIKKNEEYARKKLIRPVDIKLNEEKANKDAIQEENVDKKMISSLENQFCLFQLPTNLPLDGLYKESLARDDPDFQLENNNDIFKILTDKRFDSTGFHLDRDFKSPFVKETPIKEEKGKAQEKDINFDVYQFGKLCVMKDGSMKMRIGENYFDLLPGMEDNFYKEIISINPQKKIAHNLFPVQQKIIVKPDISSL